MSESNIDLKKIKPPKGLKDVLPDNQEFFTYMKKVVRHRSRQSGFRRITTPFIEQRNIYESVLGENHPIVKNSLYGCGNENEDTVLRPDLAPGMIRAYHTNKMFNEVQPVQLYSIEPVFLKDQIFKQSNRIEAIIIGEGGNALDTQLIYLASTIFRDLRVRQAVSLEINCLGTEEEMEDYKNQLRDFLFGKERYFTDEQQKALESNPLLLFTMNNEDIKILQELAPKMRDVLSEATINQYEDLKRFLKGLDIDFVENKMFYGEKSFYDGFVFRMLYTHNEKTISICEGGRYNNVSQRLLETSIPACGFSVEVERLITLIKREALDVPHKDNLQIFVAQLSQDAKLKCLSVIETLREQGIKTVGSLGKGSIREQLDLAARFKVPYTILIGLTEVRENKLILRNMARGSQETIDTEEVVPKLIEIFGEENLEKYKPGEIL